MTANRSVVSVPIRFQRDRTTTIPIKKKELIMNAHIVSSAEFPIHLVFSRVLFDEQSLYYELDSISALNCIFPSFEKCCMNQHVINTYGYRLMVP
jgi:hypothetical protein